MNHLMPFFRKKSIQLILSALFVYCVQSGVPTEAHASTSKAPVPPTTFRILAVTNPIAGLFYDINKKPVELSASPGMLSSIYMRPSDGRISIYKIVVSPDNLQPPRRVVVAEANIEEGGPYLMLLNLPDDSTNVNLSILDDSWIVHPGEAIRVLNLSKRHIAVQLGKSQKEIKSGQSEFFQKNGSSTVIKLKTAALEEGNWTLRTQLPQAIYPYCRQMFLIQDSNPSLENPVPMELNVYNVVDTSPAPERSN